MSNLHWPQSIQGISSSAGPFAQTLATDSQDNAALIGELQTVFHTRPKRADEAQSLAHLRGQLQALSFEAKTLSVSPYDFGVGQDATLTPANAAAHLIRKMQDASDPVTAGYGLVFWLGGNTEQALAEQLAAVTGVLAFPEWLQVSARASARVYAEYQNRQIPLPALTPYWTKETFALAAPTRQSLQAVSRQVSQVESVATDSLAQALRDLAQTHQAQVDAMRQEIEAIEAAFTGNCSAIALAGSMEEMMAQLEQTTLPYYPYAVMLMVLSDDPMTFLHDMVGL